MKRLPLLALGAGLLVATGSAMAATDLMTSIPSNSVTVTDWYKQDVYDPQNNKIGQVMDVLVSPDGKVNSLIVGVGGFLGAGEKDVAVDFSADQADHERQLDLPDDEHHQERPEVCARLQVRSPGDEMGARHDEG